MKKLIQSISRAPLPDRLAAVVWVLAVAVRIWGAWVARVFTQPDPTVVALMARHMAALKEFPVFFYGQAYMGSLEPMASAVMVRLLGSTGFAVALGPVVFAALALFFLWRWARDAAGPWGGLAAVLAGLWGPSGYFQFQMAARGGYMVALFVDALVLFAAARMAARLRDGESVGGWKYLLLGLLAGMGMWSNMIVAPALLTAALLLVHAMRGRIWRHGIGILSGFVGFLVGFSPWLAYNVRHGWPSLAMSQIGGHDPLLKSVVNSWNRFLLLMDAGQTAAGPQLPLVLALVVLGLVAAGVAVTILQGRRASLRAQYARAAAVLFCLIFVWVFATSGFTRTHTARYWVPVVPGLAVLMAVACAAAGRRVWRGTAWGLLSVLTVIQSGLCVMELQHAARRVAPAQKAYHEIGEVLEHAGADALMAPIQLYSLNFALNERFAVSNGKQKFYEPILRRAELSDSPAYSSDFKGIEAFLRQRGAQWDSAQAGGRRILWNVQPPADGSRLIPAGEIESLRTADGVEWTDVLMDRNLDTAWAPGQPDATLEWTFAHPQDIHSIQLVFSHGMGDAAFDFPRHIRLEVKSGGKWSTRMKDSALIPLEWSGPRVYFPSGFARPEFWLRAKNVEALRIGLLDTQVLQSRVSWRLAEVNAFAPESEETQPLDPAPVMEGLRDRDPAARVYAPRWLSIQMLKRRWVPEDRLSGLTAHVFDSPEEMPRDGRIATDQPCLFFVELRHAATTRVVLLDHTRATRESTYGPWVCFAVEPGDWAVDGLDLPPAVVWTGDTLLTGRTPLRVAAALRRLHAEGNSEETSNALLQEIIRWRPAALSALTEEMVARLGGEEAVTLRKKAACLPRQPCATEFANGIRLEGVDIEPADVKAGGTVQVRLVWSAREDYEAGQEIVFIHFRNAKGKIVAQDDFQGSPLLWGRAAVRPVPGECVEDIRHIALPKTLPEGSVTVSVGLYQPKNGRRVKVLHSEAPEVHRNAATWPNRL